MSKFLRDNGFALTLAILCLLLSAWLYGADILGQSSVAQLSAENDRANPVPDINKSLGGPRMPDIAQESSPRQIPRAKSATPAQPRPTGVAGLPEITDSDLTPTGWQADPEHR
jgi:hypothetical protein